MFSAISAGASAGAAMLRRACWVEFDEKQPSAHGASIALAGMLLVPMLIVLLLTALYAEFAQAPAVAGALRGMGAVAAGLVFSTGLKLLGTLRRNPMGLATCLVFGAATVLAIAWLRLPLVSVILGLGSIAIAVAWVRLRGSRA